MEILDYEGDPAVTLEAIKSGKGFGEMVKLSRQAEKEGRAKTLEEMKKNAPLPLGQMQPAAAGDETFEAKVQQIMGGEKLTRGPGREKSGPGISGAARRLYRPAKSGPKIAPAPTGKP